MSRPTGRVLAALALGAAVVSAGPSEAATIVLDRSNGRLRAARRRKTYKAVKNPAPASCPAYVAY